MTNPEQKRFKHALPAEDLVLPGECPASLDELRASLHDQYEPCNVTESILVNEIAEQFWRLRRMRGVETRALQPEMADQSIQTGLAAFVARTMAAAERGMNRAIATLQKLQADRGFVPSKTSKRVSNPKSSPTPLPENVDFGDLDVQKILADYDEDLHPFVLEDLADLAAVKKRVAARTQLRS
jgi:hypothetical protein